MQRIVRDFRAEHIAQALVNGNDFGSFQTAPPQVLLLPPSGDGTYENGDKLSVAGRIMLLPYAEGGPGANFSLRVYGWKRVQPGASQGTEGLFIPFLLVELACVTCNVAGPPSGTPGVSPYPLKDSERLCDTISLTQGTLGVDGLINSTGPGTDLVATAFVDLQGSSYFTFDFDCPQPGSVGMNCFWCRA